MRQFTLNSKPQFVQNNFEFNERPCSMFLILNILVIALHLETVTQPIIFFRCYQPPHTTKTHSLFSKQQTIANIERNPHFSVSLLHPKVFSIFLSSSLLHSSMSPVGFHSHFCQMRRNDQEVKPV